MAEMKAMVLRQYHQPMEWVDVETPSVGEDEILLQVKACGLCYTDLKIYICRRQPVPLTHDAQTLIVQPTNSRQRENAI